MIKLRHRLRVQQPAAEIMRRVGFRSTTTVRGDEAGPTNATDLMTSLRGGCVYRKFDSGWTRRTDGI